jgi:hypothetical protein
MDISNYLSVHGTENYSVLFYLIAKSSLVIDYSKTSLPKLNLSTHDLCQYTSDNKLVLMEVTCKGYQDALFWVESIISEAKYNELKFIWCMFDGAFGSCDELFTEQQMQQIYAVYSVDFGEEYCFEMEFLLSEHWQRNLLRSKKILRQLIVLD